VCNDTRYNTIVNTKQLFFSWTPLRRRSEETVVQMHRVSWETQKIQTSAVAPG